MRCTYCFTRSPATAPEPSRGRGQQAPEEKSRAVACGVCQRELGAAADEPGTCIVMAGARNTGKSIFIAVMIEQLRQYVRHDLGNLQPASPMVQKIFQEKYVKPLYEQRGIMAPTASAETKDAYQREALHWVITTRHQQRHHLIIRDVAGEDLERGTRIDPSEQAFFAQADGVFFLYDPLKVDDIRNTLRGKVPDQVRGEDPMPVLDRVLGLMQGGAPRLAVIMSKFDVMHMLGRVGGAGDWTAIMGNAGAALYRDLGPVALPDDVDGGQLHEEIYSLLIKLGAGSLVGRLGAAPGQLRFFAVSALGEPPNGEHLDARGIAPFRCLDPLRWMLTGTGIM